MNDLEKHIQPTQTEGAPSREDLERMAHQDEAAAEMAKDAVRKMTDGQDRDVGDDAETLEEAVGGSMRVSKQRELTRSDAAPADAEPAPLPTAVGEGP